MILSALLKKYRKLFKKNNSIRFGAEVKNSILGYNINISRYSFLNNSKIDNYSSVGRNTTILNAKIGKFCSISWNVTIGATSHDLNRLSTHAFSYISYYGFTKQDKRFVEQTIIGHDVWIGANAIIMPGVKIGDGAVIGAASVVTKDVQDFEIVYGIPAKHRGYRFSEEAISKIKAMKWWDWSDSELRRKIEIFKIPFEVKA
ncbi:CatB-related O-acetyltransferase [Hyunsoonleella flava]|uniref:CatB-related O-acetyltransferase n=1 Tax=Hyunsoonleella flava TaxID=2527939 RepID=A0A4Q9FAK2_9FLAO|nr:CatB-related O-acetyltransferase [Hyunsoonleella flava]TBN00184.1 CatB-related O-acetyltransferase [Hyunsoonleella flava]